MIPKVGDKVQVNPAFARANSEGLYYGQYQLPESFFVSALLEPLELKAANTRVDARSCTACGGPLRDPMPWLPCLRRCPKCEP
jgi:hypothetical protein